MKESEKIDKYLDLSRKEAEKAVAHEGDDDSKNS